MTANKTKDNQGYFVLAIVTLILLFNICDAVITVFYITNGYAREINPITGAAIEFLGYYFVIPKIIISLLVGLVLLLTWEDYRIARVGGLLVFLVYATLTAYHFVAYLIL